MPTPPDARHRRRYIENRRFHGHRLAVKTAPDKECDKETLAFSSEEAQSSSYISFRHPE